MSADHPPESMAGLSPILEAKGVSAVLRRDASAARRQRGDCTRRDPGRHGSERLGQIDLAALPGGHPGSGLRARSGSPGQRVDSLREQERSALRRDRFGFVFQFGQLVPELTAEENVALPLLLGGMRRAQALDEARSWFERLGLEGMERHRSGELSGGQAQRVALARGLVANPEVLFADEPTGSLDSLTGELVMELLTSAARRQGTTVVLVTHEPRVAAYADREVVVRDGTVASLDRSLR